ncbi:MAG: MBL fold metallo-hydrolase [Proteobacteria bacterium]|nr:MBL fold metallo-hydrolase [Pseudomonadota bacterium]
MIRLLFLSLMLCTSLVARGQEQAPYLTILGVAQDAGYPQAGCYEPHCLPGWQDKSLKRAATSIAVIDPVAGHKYLFEATPDLPQQLYALDSKAPNHSFDLAGVFLTHAHIGHYTGLMFFGHEAMSANSIPVYAMPRMQHFLETNGPWSQLVSLQNIQLIPLQDQSTQAFENVSITPFLVPHRDEYSETVGFHIEGPNKTAIFIPDINKWSDWDTDIVELVKSVDYALLDATFYTDGELGNRDMSQIPHPFVSETMTLFADFSQEQRAKVWFIHFNHTNLLFNENSEQSAFVRFQGFNIAQEGIELPL